MNSEAIQSALESTVALALSKGIKTPNCILHFRANTQPRAEFSWYTDEHDDKDGIYKYEFFHANSIAEILANLNEFVIDYPTIEKRKAASFHRALARTIELGKANDFSIDLNPLIQMMEELSKNALEDHRTPVGKEIDDEIPF